MIATREMADFFVCIVHTVCEMYRYALFLVCVLMCGIVYIIQLPFPPPTPHR